MAAVVAPLAGAWIEISVFHPFSRSPGVAPLAGAWIEIEKVYQESWLNKSRSPRGSVD